MEGPSREVPVLWKFKGNPLPPPHLATNCSFFFYRTPFREIGKFLENRRDVKFKQEGKIDLGMRLIKKALRRTVILPILVPSLGGKNFPP